MKYPFLQLSDVTAPWVDELSEAATNVVRSGWYLHGPHTEALEKEMARVCETSHCVATSNGLDAIRLTLRALIELGRLHEGDEVIVPANTYIASVLPITEFGLRPVLAEPSSATFNLDSADVERRLTGRTRALMVVHLYGTPAWDATLMHRLASEGITIIEDNAQAIGALSATPGLAGTHATGGLGHVAATSFYPTKNIGALGDAGAVTTSDDELAATVRTLANYGADRRYHNIMCGYNCRIDEIQAAMLLVKMRHLDEICTSRQKVAEAYAESISTPLVKVPGFIEGTRQVWHQFVVRVPEEHRDRFRAYLETEGVGTDIHYAVPPHRQPCYWPTLGTDFPVTDKLSNEIVSLPIGCVTPTQAHEIATIINRYE